MKVRSKIITVCCVRLGAYAHASKRSASKRSASKSFVYRLLVMFSWIALHFVDFKIMLRSRVIARLPTWNAIVAFSEQCVAKLLYGSSVANQFSS